MTSLDWVDRSDSPAYRVLVDEGRLEVLPWVALALGVAGVVCMVALRGRAATRIMHDARFVVGGVVPLFAVANIVIATMKSPLFGYASHVFDRTRWLTVGVLVGASFACIVMAILSVRFSSIRAYVALGLVIAGACVTLPLHALAAALEHGYLYDLRVDQRVAMVHVDRTVTIAPALEDWRTYRTGFLGLSTRTVREQIPFESTGWTPRETTAIFHELGEQWVEVEVDRPYVRHLAKAKLTVGADRPNPGLPLAVGNAWHYEIEEEHHQAQLLSGSHTSRAPNGTIDVRVVGAARIGGLATYRIEVQDASQSGETEPPRTFVVYGWNGDTRVLQTARDRRESADEKSLDVLLPRADDPYFVRSGEGDVERTCEIAFVTHFACSCAPPKGSGPIEIEGPTSCVRSNDSELGSVAQGLLLLVTLGMAPITSDHTHVMLVESHRAR